MFPRSFSWISWPTTVSLITWNSVFIFSPSKFWEKRTSVIRISSISANSFPGISSSCASLAHTGRSLLTIDSSFCKISFVANASTFDESWAEKCSLHITLVVDRQSAMDDSQSITFFCDIKRACWLIASAVFMTFHPDSSLRSLSVTCYNNL